MFYQFLNEYLNYFKYNASLKLYNEGCETPGITPRYLMVNDGAAPLIVFTFIT